MDVARRKLILLVKNSEQVKNKRFIILLVFSICVISPLGCLSSPPLILRIFKRKRNFVRNIFRSELYNSGSVFLSLKANK